MGAAKKSKRDQDIAFSKKNAQQRLKRVVQAVRTQVQNKGELYTKNTEVPFGGE